MRKRLSLVDVEVAVPVEETGVVHGNGPSKAILVRCIPLDPWPIPHERA